MNAPTPDSNKTVVGVWFKDEDYDETSDQPIGPMGFIYEGEGDPRQVGRPFDPNRQPDPWVGYRDAGRIADELGVPLRSS
jgi:hypothetical protein